jgi:hypothetical protein
MAVGSARTLRGECKMSEIDPAQISPQLLESIEDALLELSKEEPVSKREGDCTISVRFPIDAFFDVEQTAPE